MGQLTDAAGKMTEKIMEQNPNVNYLPWIIAGVLFFIVLALVIIMFRRSSDKSVINVSETSSSIVTEMKNNLDNAMKHSSIDTQLKSFNTDFDNVKGRLEKIKDQLSSVKIVTEKLENIKDSTTSNQTILVNKMDEQNTVLSSLVAEITDLIDKVEFKIKPNQKRRSRPIDSSPDDFFS